MDWSATTAWQAPPSCRQAALQPASAGGRSQAAPDSAQQLVDVETRRGPFTLAGLTVTVVPRSKRLLRSADPDATALASLEIRAADGTLQHREVFPHAVEHGRFSESCSVEVHPLSGSTGAGLLLAAGCTPAAPLAGGPWQLFGAVNGRLVRLGKPLHAQGELGDFVPGGVTPLGRARQIGPDVLRIRVWTGYFFVSVPVRIDWRAGTLALGQRCLGQTEHGLVEEGCELPVEDVHRVPQDRVQTFVRLFREPTERSGPAVHVVVGRDSAVSVVAARARVDWNEEPEGITLSPADDVWVRVRIDGEEGWIHTEEDLNATGLFRSG
jgi:hypothetical protein